MTQARPSHPTAVVVEDDAIQREMIALLLEDDFDVVQCEDAETASLVLKARHPSLLITDINLTGRMNGVELARIARRSNPKARVFVISGKPPTGDLPDEVTFFAKPVYPVALLREAMR